MLFTKQNRSSRAARSALKVIKSALASPELLRRFERESQALARLQHPGIAQVYEAGTADTGSGSEPFFAMEFIAGRPLTKYAEEQHLNVRQRLELIAQVCDAVQHAHQRGIIHRDLKPGNILLDENGHPKILDFGVARVTDSDAQATRQTDIGQLVGTLAYMSPEQALADSLELDTRSDVYALGVILYELLAGKLPYSLSHKLHEAVLTIREQDPAPLTSFSRSYRGDIETIVAKALEKDKTRRYASAAELASDIRRYLQDEPIVARPASVSYQLHKFARRNKALVAGAATVFVVLVAGTAVSTWEAVQARRQRDTADAINAFLQKDLLAQASANNQARPNIKPDPHLEVRTALDRAAEHISGKFDKQPLIEAAIRHTIGSTYIQLGLYPEATRQLQRSLELRQRALGNRHAETLNSLQVLGLVCRLQGKYAQAEQLLTKAALARTQVLGTDHEDTIDSMESLATLYLLEGKYREAEQVYTKNLAVFRRLHGEEHDQTANTMAALGAVYYYEGKYADAERVESRALEIGRHLRGVEHPATLTAMGNLAATYQAQGKFAQAETLFLQQLDIT